MDSKIVLGQLADDNSSATSFDGEDEGTFDECHDAEDEGTFDECATAAVAGPSRRPITCDQRLIGG